MHKLHLRGNDAIARGEKTKEYRENKRYWRTRIRNASPLEEVHFYCGYPSRKTPALIRRVKRVVMEQSKKSIEIHLEGGK